MDRHTDALTPFGCHCSLDTPRSANSASDTLRVLTAPGASVGADSPNVPGVPIVPTGTDTPNAPWGQQSIPTSNI